jgi:hypothetical protein
MFGSDEAIAIESVQCSVLFRRRPSSSQCFLVVHFWRSTSRGSEPAIGFDTIVRRSISLHDAPTTLNRDVPTKSSEVVAAIALAQCRVICELKRNWRVVIMMGIKRKNQGNLFICWSD